MYAGWIAQETFEQRLAMARLHQAELAGLIATRSTQVSSGPHARSLESLQGLFDQVSRWITDHEQGPRAMRAGGLAKIRQERP